MWFWWFIFLCDCLIPVLMIIAGRMMWRHCPKQINGVVGYRTKQSMKNMDTWKFAHEFAGKLWWRAGWGFLILAVPVHVVFYGSDEDVLGILCTVVTTVELIFLIGSIIPTEIALKKHFN
ncbi:MAG: SdpI family protein [Lachnospiraceae bacterium]|nr:SdpI family protein [Lachnospiraceae bacterium]